MLFLNKLSQKQTSRSTGESVNWSITRNLAAGKAAGFSLIEVLVATALLIMIVGMIGFVFRQSSMSWDSGIRRAEGITRVRAVIGAIERDVRSAIDAREFGKEIAGYQNFTSEKLCFVALLEPEVDDPDQRVPALITYKAPGGIRVERTAQRLKCSGGTWSLGTSETSTLLDSEQNAAIKIVFDSVDPPGATRGGLPAYVTIQAKFITATSFSSLSVVSYGRDGKRGTRDDIIVE